MKLWAGTRAQQLTMAVLQRSQVRFPALTRWLTTVLNSTSRGPDTPSSDGPGCQAHTGYTYTHAGKYSEFILRKSSEGDVQAKGRDPGCREQSATATAEENPSPPLSYAFLRQSPSQLTWQKTQGRQSHAIPQLVFSPQKTRKHADSEPRLDTG